MTSEDRTLLDALDTVAWGELKHNYGPAADIPDLLCTIAHGDAEQAQKAAGTMDNHLYHQGGWVCSAATAALPFLLSLAADPRIAGRVDLVETVTSIAETATTAQPRFVDEGWPGAWEGQRPTVLSLLVDGDPAMRRAAVDLLARGGGPIRANLDCLLERWQHEEDLAARLDIVLALGSIASGPGPDDTQDVRALLDSLLADPQPSVRLVAIHAWGSIDPHTPARHLDLALDILTDPRTATDLATAGPDHNLQQSIGRTYELLAADPIAATRLVTRLANPSTIAASGADTYRVLRRTVLAKAGALLAQWRSPQEAILPVLAQCLEDTDPEVRLRAAHLLAALGTGAAPYADQLAAHLDDTGTNAQRIKATVADNALWALARLHDPRILPNLPARLYASRQVFATHASSYSRDTRFYYPTLPGIHEVLIPLRAHADLLLPSIRELMQHAAATDDWQAGRAFATLLQAWGEDALPALPELVTLLKDQRIWELVVPAIAAIGPAAADAAPALQRCTEHPTPRDTYLLPWAAWRIGGDPQPVVEHLGNALARDRIAHHTIHRLGSLGPLAAPYVDRLRDLNAPPGSWEYTETAFALWSITGDHTATMSVLETVAHQLANGKYLPVMLPALQRLAHTDTPLTTTAEAGLRQALTLDRRLASSGSWRTFIQDQEIRTAMDQLLNHTQESQ